MKKLKGYICGTDTTDIWCGANDVKIYSSIKALKKARSCWKECGIEEIPLSNLKMIVKPTRSTRVERRKNKLKI